MMRVLLLSDIDTPHTIKWATGLAGRVARVGVFGLIETSNTIYQDYDNIDLFCYGLPKTLAKSGEGTLHKWRYLKAVFALKRVVREFKPDIVHAHYASSYGLLGRLSQFEPLVISVWGRDVFTFPDRSFLHRLMIQWVLRKAQFICSTSQIMARRTLKYTKDSAHVVPFGVDTAVFRPKQVVVKPFAADDIVIGCIKSLEPKYGLADLIAAFAQLKQQLMTPLNTQVKLLLVGGGSQRQALAERVKTLGIEDDVTFTGPVPYQRVVDYHNMLDIAVFASTEDSESFGVSVLEASACGRPVIVTDIGGLPEVVVKDQTGLLVPVGDIDALVEALKLLVTNPKQRMAFGQQGRQFVEMCYAWQNCLDRQILLYDRCLAGDSASDINESTDSN